MQRQILFLTIAWLLIGWISQSLLAVDNCGLTPIVPKTENDTSLYGLGIVGGQKAVPYSWPWQALLAITDYEDSESLLKFTFKCGASLIDENWAITSATCVEGYENRPEMFLIKFGIYERNDQADLSRHVQQVVVHPQYATPKQFSHDIALLRLSERVEFSKHIQPVCLPGNISDLIVVEGKSAYVTGWGSIREGGPVSEHLRQVSVPFLNMEHCQREYTANGQDSIDETMLCAGRKGVDSCQEDAGGPLVSRHSDGRWFLAGTVSWGRGCARSRYAGVYARVPAMCQFINDQLEYEICL